MKDVLVIELRKSAHQLEEDLCIFVKAEIGLIAADWSEILQILEAKGWNCILRIYGLTTPEAATAMFDANDLRC